MSYDLFVNRAAATPGPPILGEMPTQVFRAEKRPGIDSRLVAHVSGKSRPATARKPPEGAPPVIVLEEDVAAARKSVRQAVKNYRKPGPKPEPALEAFWQGPVVEDVGVEKVKEWAKECLDWYREVLPESVIAVAAIHLDETSAHLHLLASGVAAGGLGERYWRAQLAEEPPPDANPTKADAARQLSLAQDRLHEAVNHHWGLERGEKGSKSRHQEIDRSKALAAREDHLDEREQTADLIESSLLYELHRVPQFFARAARAMKKRLERRLEQVSRLTDRLTAAANRLADAAARHAHAESELQRGLVAGYELRMDVERAAAEQGVEPPTNPQEAYDWLKNQQRSDETPQPPQP